MRATWRSHDLGQEWRERGKRGKGKTYLLQSLVAILFEVVFNGQHTAKVFGQEKEMPALLQISWHATIATSMKSAQVECCCAVAPGGRKLKQLQSLFNIRRNSLASQIHFRQVCRCPYMPTLNQICKASQRLLELAVTICASHIHVTFFHRFFVRLHGPIFRNTQHVKQSRADQRIRLFLHDNASRKSGARDAHPTNTTPPNPRSRPGRWGGGGRFRRGRAVRPGRRRPRRCG